MAEIKLFCCSLLKITHCQEWQTPKDFIKLSNPTSFRLYCYRDEFGHPEFILHDIKIQSKSSDKNSQKLYKVLALSSLNESRKGNLRLADQQLTTPLGMRRWAHFRLFGRGRNSILMFSHFSCSSFCEMKSSSANEERRYARTLTLISYVLHHWNWRGISNFFAGERERETHWKNAIFEKPNHRQTEKNEFVTNETRLMTKLLIEVFPPTKLWVRAEQEAKGVITALITNKRQDL